MDVVNDLDEVIGSSPRSIVKRGGSNFRVVHILLLDSHKNLVLQRVAPDRKPSFVLGSSVAGHVRSGESYEAAAYREAREELGVELSSILPLGKTWLDEGGRRKFIGVFVGRVPLHIRPDKQEVAGMETLPIAEVRSRVRDEDATFSETFRRVFRHVDGLDAWGAEP